MFGQSPFDDDPFFADHRNAMNSMMRGFGGGFGGAFNAIEDGRGGQQQQHRQQQHQPHQRQQQQMMNPFDQMNQQMNSMMQGMNMRVPDKNGGGNGAHSFSSSSVYSYKSDGQGPPKVYQAASEERRGPGGIKETKRAVKDSESGMQKMAVGHHLGERGHVIERSHNVRSGEQEEKQDFVGLAENDGPTFHQEWTHATRGGGGSGRQQQQQHRRQVEDRSSHRHRRGHGHALPEVNDAQRSPRDQMLK